jgi:hypothetical protein
MIGLFMGTVASATKEATWPNWPMCADAVAIGLGVSDTGKQA